MLLVVARPGSARLRVSLRWGPAGTLQRPCLRGVRAGCPLTAGEPGSRLHPAQAHRGPSSGAHVRGTGTRAGSHPSVGARPEARWLRDRRGFTVPTDMDKKRCWGTKRPLRPIASRWEQGRQGKDKGRGASFTWGLGLSGLQCPAEAGRWALPAQALSPLLVVT